MQVIEQLKKMNPERFHAIYQALEMNGFGPLDGEVAKSLNFRPQAVNKLPMVQRAKRAKQILETSKNSQLAYEIFGAYLIKTKRELITGFLDATDVKHDQGMIEDTEQATPKEAKITAAVTELDTKFPPEDVTLYLSMCAEQWPSVTTLDELWRKRTA
jgi:hypothetical protein